MKRIIIILLALSLFLSVSAQIKQSEFISSQLGSMDQSAKIIRSTRDLPSYMWAVTPTPIVFNSYYDYMIGSYNGFGLQTQDTDHGVYMSYLFKASSNARRSVHYAYLDQNSTQTPFEIAINEKTANEGMISLALDRSTQNPFFTWQAQYNATDNGGVADAFLNCYLTVDNYSEIGFARNLFETIMVIENTSSEFVYGSPSVFIGSSPFPSMRRVFVFAVNLGNKPNGQPSTSVKMAWADFENSLFDSPNLSGLDWNYRTFDYLDAIHNTPLSARAYPSFFVKDNKVAIGGFVLANMGISSANDANDIIYEAHNVFYLVNENCGVGDFDLYTFDTNRAVPNPTNQGGVDDGSGYSSFEVQDFYSNHKNLVIDNLNRLHFVGNYATTYLETENAPEEERKCWAVSQTVKDVIFDLNTHQLAISDLEPKSLNPYDNELFPIWDLNDDDQPDTYASDGSWEFQFNEIPMYYHDANNWFGYNYFRQTNATPQGWMVALWSDCTKSYLYNISNDFDFLPYAEVPEIAFAISRDNGQTWSDVCYLNSIVTPELLGVIPSFSYLAPDIQVLDESRGRIHWMFLKDHAYGSNFLNGGNNPTADIMYAALDIDFSSSAIDNTPLIADRMDLQQNYPNPFNPSTTIKFNLNKSEMINLSVYNVKGQLVKTLSTGKLNAGSHLVTWNGQDNANNSVASGVYFYRLNSTQDSVMKKMLLIK